MKMLLSLVRPTTGRIHIMGHPMRRSTRRALLGRIGSLIEAPPAYAHLTGGENMRLVRRLLDLDTDQVDRAVRTVRLQEHLDKRVGEYSLGMMPRLDLPDLLMEVAARTGFPSAFTHYSGAGSALEGFEASVCALLVAEACNIGLTPVVKSGVPALTLGRLQQVDHAYLRSETLREANARLIQAQARIGVTASWGGGLIASADGMRFVVPPQNLHARANPTYFGLRKRGATWLNVINDQVGGLGGLVVPGTVRDSLYILDAPHARDGGPKPEMVITDTASYPDIVFGLFAICGYQFSPRIADLGDTRLWRTKTRASYGPLDAMSRQFEWEAFIADDYISAPVFCDTAWDDIVNVHFGGDNRGFSRWANGHTNRFRMSARADFNLPNFTGSPPTFAGWNDPSALPIRSVGPTTLYEEQADGSMRLVDAEAAPLHEIQVDAPFVNRTTAEFYMVADSTNPLCAVLGIFEAPAINVSLTVILHADGSYNYAGARDGAPNHSAIIATHRIQTFPSPTLTQFFNSMQNPHITCVHKHTNVGFSSLAFPPIPVSFYSSDHSDPSAAGDCSTVNP